MSFSRILGQETAVAHLKRLRLSDKLPPALLFCGPAGVGKAMAALEFAKSLHCEALAADGDPCDRCHPCRAADKGILVDVKRVGSSYQAGLTGEETERQSWIKVDTIRYLIRDLSMKSLTGAWKVAVLEEAHGMVTEAQNALLKILEEPPPRTLWILVTRQKERLLSTVLSRCHAFRFRSLAPATVVSILEARGLDPGEARRLAAMSDGSPGKALELKNRDFADPKTWAEQPLAPFRLAEKLPRELHLARPMAQDLLHVMAWHLRAEASGGRPDAGIRRSIAEIESLRRALMSNVDPRMAVELAALEVQNAARTQQSPSAAPTPRR